MADSQLGGVAGESEHLTISMSHRLSVIERANFIANWKSIGVARSQRLNNLKNNIINNTIIFGMHEDFSA